jgi:hypothetical protein
MAMVCPSHAAGKLSGTPSFPAGMTGLADL